MDGLDLLFVISPEASDRPGRANTLLDAATAEWEDPSRMRLANQHGRASREGLRRLKRWAAESGVSFEALDARQQIFLIRRAAPATTRADSLRPASDVVQHVRPRLRRRRAKRSRAT